MNDKMRQAELLDQFFDDLLENSRILPPANLDIETADTAFQITLVEQANLAKHTDNKAQTRVWNEVLLAANTKSQTQTSFNWFKLANLASQALTALVLSCVTVLLLIGNVEQNKSSDYNTNNNYNSSLPTQPVTSYQLGFHPINRHNLPYQIDGSQESKAVADLPPPVMRTLHTNLLINAEQTLAAEVDTDSKIDDSLQHHYF
jgi:hypothetical protein